VTIYSRCRAKSAGSLHTPSDASLCYYQCVLKLPHTKTKTGQDDNSIRQGRHGLPTEPRKCVIHFYSYLPIPISLFPLECRVASSGMAWRGEDDAGNVIAVSSSDIKWARWLRVARGFQLRLGLKDRRREVFDGFGREVSPYS